MLKGFKILWGSKILGGSQFTNLAVFTMLKDIFSWKIERRKGFVKCRLFVWPFPPVFICMLFEISCIISNFIITKLTDFFGKLSFIFSFKAWCIFVVFFQEWIYSHIFDRIYSSVICLKAKSAYFYKVFLVGHCNLNWATNEVIRAESV